MASDEYEFVPTKDFERLSSELQKLKQNPFISKEESKDMKTSIDTLHSSVDNLLSVFKKAHQEMTQEERESRIFKKELQPVADRFEKIESNQETIANGIVVVSDAITKLTHKVNGMKTDMDRLLSASEKISKQLDRLDKPDGGSSGSRITRKYYTTRQYQQPLQDDNSSQMSDMNNRDNLHNSSVSDSLQNVRLNATLQPQNSPSQANSYYSSPVMTTVEPINRLSSNPSQFGSSSAPPSFSTPMPKSPSPIGAPPGFVSSSPSPPPPQNMIPPMSENGLSNAPEKKDTGGFSLFKK